MSKQLGDFSKFCGLLRIPQLYLVNAKTKREISTNSEYLNLKAGWQLVREHITMYQNCVHWDSKNI